MTSGRLRFAGWLAALQLILQASFCCVVFWPALLLSKAFWGVLLAAAITDWLLAMASVYFFRQYLSQIAGFNGLNAVLTWLNILLAASLMAGVAAALPFVAPLNGATFMPTWFKTTGFAAAIIFSGLSLYAFSILWLVAGLLLRACPHSLCGTKKLLVWLMVWGGACSLVSCFLPFALIANTFAGGLTAWLFFHTAKWPGGGAPDLRPRTRKWLAVTCILAHILLVTGSLVALAYIKKNQAKRLLQEEAESEALSSPPTWPNSLTIAHAAGRFHQLAFSDMGKGWAVGPAGTIWHTQNNGETWQQTGQRAESAEAWLTAGPNGQWVLFAASENNTLTLSHDGGAQWHTISLPEILDPMTSTNTYRIGLQSAWLDAASSSIYALYATQIFVSRDFGRQWVAIRPELPGQLQDGELCGVWPVAPDSWFGVVYKGISHSNGRLTHSSNQGRTWRQVTNPIEALRGLPLDQHNQLLAAFSQADITVPFPIETDPGALAIHLQQNASLPFEAIADFPLPAAHQIIIRQERGWILEADGTVWHSADGGNRWYHQRQGQPDFYQYHFKTSQLGWAEDGEGQIFSTQNAGQTWDLAGEGQGLWAPRQSQVVFAMDSKHNLFVWDADGRQQPKQWPETLAEEVTGSGISPQDRAYWAIAGEKLFLFNPANDKWASYPLTTSMLSKPIYEVIPGPKQQVWLVTPQRLFYSAAPQRSFSNAGPDPGNGEFLNLLADDTGQIIWLLGSHGLLWHSGNQGRQWHKIASGTRHGLYRAQWESHQQNAWVFTDGDELLKLENQPPSAEKVAAGWQGEPQSLCFTPQGTAVLVTAYSILYREDEDQSFQPIALTMDCQTCQEVAGNILLSGPDSAIQLAPK